MRLPAVAVATAVLAAPSLAPSGVPASSVGCPKPATHTVRAAPGSGHTVALTFDDGPSDWTPKILAVLARKKVHATFFDTGKHAAQYPHYVRAELAAGHVVGDHTWDHRYPRTTPWTEAYLRDQIGRTANELHEITDAPVCLFRPPGGFSSRTLAPVAREFRMSVIDWSVDPQDWRQPGYRSAAATDRIATAARPGGLAHPIVILHAGKASHEPDSQVSSYRGNTVAALPTIIDWYRAHHYRFVTLH
jgi:peptidoglycan/xylan/chitin deacetylase (PgdA/CDA1 family)